jgi:hypothetical protein
LSIAIEELREGKLEVGFRERPEKDTGDEFLSASSERSSEGEDQGAA